MSIRYLQVALLFGLAFAGAAEAQKYNSAPAYRPPPPPPPPAYRAPPPPAANTNYGSSRSSGSGYSGSTSNSTYRPGSMSSSSSSSSTYRPGSMAANNNSPSRTGSMSSPAPARIGNPTTSNMSSGTSRIGGTSISGTKPGSSLFGAANNNTRPAINNNQPTASMNKGALSGAFAKAAGGGGGGGNTGGASPPGGKGGGGSGGKGGGGGSGGDKFKKGDLTKLFNGTNRIDNSNKPALNLRPKPTDPFGANAMLSEKQIGATARGAKGNAMHQKTLSQNKSAVATGTAPAPRGPGLWQGQCTTGSKVGGTMKNCASPVFNHAATHGANATPPTPDPTKDPKYVAPQPPKLPVP
ncbi:hypothetical protein BH09PSE5_BH09PSE5_05100 [soil metagenome]